jgi:REP element-mobilizing transposase RayT
MYFFTLIMHDRRPFLLFELPRQCLRHAWNEVKRALPFEQFAVCLLPDCLHGLLSLPDRNDDYSKRVARKRRKTYRVVSRCRWEQLSNEQFTAKTRGGQHIAKIIIVILIKVCQEVFISLKYRLTHLLKQKYIYYFDERATAINCTNHGTHPMMENNCANSIIAYHKRSVIKRRLAQQRGLCTRYAHAKLIL